MTTPSTAVPGDRVALFVTCVGEILTPDVPAAVVHVLRAAGCDVTVPAGQTCCGQPAWNSGFTAEAAKVARASLEALDADPDTTVVVPAGSCATMLRVYWPQLFELDGDPSAAARARSVAARTREFTEYLAERDLPELQPIDVTLAVHQSCHLLRELHAGDAPAAALDRIPGCDRVAWPADDRCCGFGGTFSVNLPETSVAMADEKLDSLPAGVDTIVAADSSCLMHLQARADQRGLDIRTEHVAEVIVRGLPR